MMATVIRSVCMIDTGGAAWIDRALLEGSRCLRWSLDYQSGRRDCPENSMPLHLYLSTYADEWDRGKSDIKTLNIETRGV